MQSSAKRIALLVAICLLVAVPAWAETNRNVASDTLLIHRDSEGRLTRQSAINLFEMRRAARSNGFIGLWLSLDADRLFGERTTTEQEYNRACVAVLARVVNSGNVWHPTAGAWNNGPICYVRATSLGLGILARDRRISQIMGSTHTP